MDTTNCTSCGAEVIWTKTRRGKSMMVNAQPVQADTPRHGTSGNFALTEWDRPEHRDTVILAEYLTSVEAEQARIAGRPTYVSHFAVCPNADAHRRRR